MRNTIFARVILMATIVTISGCRKPKLECAPGDSAAGVPGGTEVFPIRHFGRGMQGR